MMQTSRRLRTIASVLPKTRYSLIFEASGSLIFAGVLGLAFAACMGGDHPTYLAKDAASIFLTGAVLLSWSGTWFARLHYRGKVRA